MVKRFVSFMLIFIMIFAAGCKNVESSMDKQVTEEVRISRPTEEEITAIKNLLSREEQYARALDLESYIALLPAGDNELIKEQTNWFNDLKLEPVEEFSIKYLDSKKINEDFKVYIEQSYKRDGRRFSSSFFKRLVVKEGKLYDAGNYFDEISNGRFIVKYTEQNKALAEDILENLDIIFDEFAVTWDIVPDRKIVVKMFDDREALRHSIKLSMWACSGWYEFGESIRMYISDNDKVRTINNVLRHELVHLFTMLKTNGNLPYWLAEGLATNYQNTRGPESLYNLRESFKGKYLSVDELEAMELEKLTNRDEIHDYYMNSQMLVSFIIENYGILSLYSILDELGSRPNPKEGTGHENDKLYREYLHEALPKVLGLESYEVFKKLWLKSIKEHKALKSQT
ncbi:MAG: hypothetical protein ACOZCL_07190 [Bacillota bacterium]